MPQSKSKQIKALEKEVLVPVDWLVALIKHATECKELVDDPVSDHSKAAAIFRYLIEYIKTAESLIE